MVAVSAGSTPTFTATANATGIPCASAPVLAGYSSTGLGAPPSPGGSAQTAITSDGNRTLYAYLS